MAGRFVVVRDLPAGGEADVLLCADQSGALWVVKQYRQPGWAADEEVLTRLRAARSGHTLTTWSGDPLGRHVLWLADWGTDPATGLFYEVAEFIQGGSLGDLRGWPVAGLVNALVGTVAAFHEAVGAHRDVKPTNVLIRSQVGPIFVLADVGLSRAVGEGSKRFSRRDGSAAYQSPEAAQGQVSRAGDWWAVGMMLAQAALGYHPMALGDGSLPPDQVLQVELAQRDVPLHQIRDERLRLLCQGLLTRDADRRWGLEQIRAWERGETPSNGNPPAAPPGVPSGVAPSRIRPVWFAGRDHRDPQSLAAAFANDPAKAGSLLFEQRDAILLDDLRLMLRSAGLHEAEGLLSEHRSGSWVQSFLRLLVEMDPNLVPELGGHSLAPRDIARTARDVIEAGTATPAQQNAFAWVTDHDVWRLWRGLPGMPGSARASEALVDLTGLNRVPYGTEGWIGQFDDKGRWVRNSAQEVGKKALVDSAAITRLWQGARPIAIAWSLLLAVEPEQAGAELDRILDEALPTVRDLPWTASGATGPDAHLMKIACALALPLARTAQLELDSYNRARRAELEARDEANRARADSARAQDALRRETAARRRDDIRKHRGIPPGVADRIPEASLASAVGLLAQLDRLEAVGGLRRDRKQISIVKKSLAALGISL